MSAWLVLDWLRFGLAAACIAVGAVFMLGAVLGLLRFPDVFTRLHAGSGVMSLGVSVALFGVLPLCANLLMAAKILFLIVLIAALTPVLSHLVGSAAHAAGVAPARGAASVSAPDALLEGALVLALSAALLTLAMTAIAARALFVTCVCCMAAAAIAALLLLWSGAGLAAIAVVVLGAAFFPIWLLSGMLLSANTIRSARPNRLWLTLLAALGVWAILVAIAPEAVSTPDAENGEAAGLPVLLAALLFVAALAAIALVGLGERGALQRPGRGAP